MDRDPQPPLAAAEEIDGRRRRGQDNRARIVTAMMELVQSGEVSPSAEQVAARADVGLRTVFRHFQDMDSLHREMAMVISARAHAALQTPFRASAWRDRIIEMVGRRALAYERLAPFKRAADAFRHRSRFLGSDYAQMVAELRAVLERELPAEIAQDKAKVDALDMLLSFEAWSRLRNEQRLDAAATRAVLESLVRAVLP
jgi:AcrR family transcriptional regulator